MKGHCDHSNSDEGKYLIGWLTVSEIYIIIFTAGHSSIQADVVLEKELRVEKEQHLDSTGNRK